MFYLMHLGKFNLQYVNIYVKYLLAVKQTNFTSSHKVQNCERIKNDSYKKHANNKKNIKIQ